MISRLNGVVLEWSLEKDALRAVVDIHGIGYDVLLPRSSADHLRVNHAAVFFVTESVTAYDGATTLYGFLSRDEKSIFDRIRENVGGMGAKKALECVDRVAAALPDFKRAVLEGDHRLLVSVFGFTKKTAEKLVFSLKGKLDAVAVTGAEKWTSLGAGDSKDAQVVSGLVNLGYAEADARDLLRIASRAAGENAGVETLLQAALREASKRTSA